MLGESGKESDAMEVDANAYREVDKTPGGLRALLGTGFSLLKHPGARHVLAKFIFKEEEKIHGEAWQEAVRRKAGSNKATAAFLDSIDEPGCLKWLNYRLTKVIDWMTGDPDQDSRWGKIKSAIKSWVRQSFIPLFGVTLYVFDYIKAGTLFF